MLTSRTCLSLWRHSVWLLVLLLAVPAMLQAQDAAPSEAAPAGEASTAEQPAGETTTDVTAEADAPEPVDPEALLKAFAEAVRSNPAFTDEQRTAALADFETNASSPDMQSVAITEALGKLYPEFGAALVALSEEEVDKAVAQLTKFVDSEDVYLAAEARFFLARAHVMEEQFEEALRLLKPLGQAPYADKLMHGGEALFLTGVSEARLLLRDDARKHLTRFVNDYPSAPERLIAGANQQLLELDAIDDGSIVDVQDRMEYSRRRLALERSDKPTQTEQDNIIAMLDKLIKEAEDKEQSGGGGGGSGSGGRGSRGGKGGSNPSGGATESTAPEGEANVGDLGRTNRGRKGEDWGNLRDKKREEVLSALKAKFPDRYRELVEEYYKTLQDE